ncbi:MAG TPA: preprotein translocase subunit YajC [Actinomycetota bacterium]
MVTLLPIVLIGVVFYFLLIRPQQRRARSQREMTQSTQVGDEVVTIGGLFGVVREVDDDSVLLEVAPGTELRFLRTAIARKLTADDEVPAEDEAEDEDEDGHEHDEPDDDQEHHYLEPDEKFGKDQGSGDKS